MAETSSDSGCVKFPLSGSPAELRDSAGCDPNSAHRVGPASPRPFPSEDLFHRRVSLCSCGHGVGQARIIQGSKAAVQRPPLGIRWPNYWRERGYISRALTRPVRRENPGMSLNPRLLPNCARPEGPRCCLVLPENPRPSADRLLHPRPQTPQLSLLSLVPHHHEPEPLMLLSRSLSAQ